MASVAAAVVSVEFAIVAISQVDWHDDPVGELRRLWSVWELQKQDYRTRGLDPTAAPSYGVPGDL